MNKYVPAGGITPAKIAIVGEAPGGEEEREGRPFCGPAGHLLNELLMNGAIPRSACFVTNVSRFRPPDNKIQEFIDHRKKHSLDQGMVLYKGRYVQPFIIEHVEQLKQELEACQPNVIIALGNAALWALTDQWGITDWRGSVMPATLCRREDGQPFKVVPTIHPAAIFKQYQHKFLVAQDMRRIGWEVESPEIQVPPYRFVVRPQLGQVRAFVFEQLDRLEKGKVKLTLDIETRRRQTACLGIGTSTLDAFCIPFLVQHGSHSYWSSVEEELEVVNLIQRLVTHPNAECVGQNFLYDDQYTARHWGFIPQIVRDTMLTHHTLFPALEKSLVMQSSLYCRHHCYWKDEGKEWHVKIDEDNLWYYNCKDCIITYEIDDALLELTKNLQRQPQVDFQNRLFYPALRMMLRGVKRDRTKTNEYDMELEQALKERQDYLNDVVGHPINPNSPQQLQRLFYQDLKIHPVTNRKTHAYTVDEDALETIGQREPLVRPIVRVINEFRSLRLVKSTFVDAECDWDGRIRCSYNPAGTITFRWSSSTDAFGMGGNLQNITKGGSSHIAEYCKQQGPQSIQDLAKYLDCPTAKVWDELDKLMDSGAVEVAGQSDKALVSYRLLTPNVRRLFIPDDDYVWMDWDLDRADLQVVAWEAGDPDLKQMLREGADMHTVHAKELGCIRQVAKGWCHATNYGARPSTCARNFGLTTHVAERMQKRYFQIHPGIHAWHKRTEHSLATTRSVRNALGYVCFFFDRLETLLSKALAWVPQSTVGLVINIGLERIDRELPAVQPLLQVHDSLDLQTHKDNFPACVPDIQRLLAVTIPYEDPLIIPASMKHSYTSWGDCS